jgi:hypothetical protein
LHGQLLSFVVLPLTLLRVSAHHDSCRLEHPEVLGRALVASTPGRGGAGDDTAGSGSSLVGLSPAVLILLNTVDDSLLFNFSLYEVSFMLHFIIEFLSFLQFCV